MRELGADGGIWGLEEVRGEGERYVSISKARQGDGLVPLYLDECY